MVLCNNNCEGRCCFSPHSGTAGLQTTHNKLYLTHLFLCIGVCLSKHVLYYPWSSVRIRRWQRHVLNLCVGGTLSCQCLFFFSRGKINTSDLRWVGKLFFFFWENWALWVKKTTVKRWREITTSYFHIVPFFKLRWVREAGLSLNAGILLLFTATLMSTAALDANVCKKQRQKKKTQKMDQNKNKIKSRVQQQRSW